MLRRLCRRKTTYPMATELLKELIEAGVHFGHQSKKWHPRMKPFILTVKNGVHVINLEETAKQLETAASFLSVLAKEGKKILFVGCKRQAQDAVREAAEATGQYYVNNRWLGGTLTNLETIRKSVQRLKYLETIESQPEFKQMSKKELAALGRERAKLQRNLSGIRDMNSQPDAMVIVDSHREAIAVAEGNRLGIPIVAMTDSNADPDPIAYPIASNDDAVRSIRIVLQNLVDPVVGALETTGRAPRNKQ
jgi:small subunit ribosomal protein S2